MEIIVYSTPTCPYCIMAEEFLKKNNVEFTKYDISQNKEKAKEAIEKSGQMAVPVIDIDGKIIIGFDEEELKKALNLE